MALPGREAHRGGIIAYDSSTITVTGGQLSDGLVGFDSLCYIWENGGPKDTPITSTKRDASRYLILRTAKEDGTGKWYLERRNILEDYTRVFGEAPREKAIIGIQIDSDSTESSAEAYYRNIYRRKS